jgi:hypothetical protein
VGSVFAVIGTVGDCEQNARVLIADGRLISVRKPKRKNPNHLISAGIFSEEVASRLAGGKRIDDGWLCDVITRLETQISRLIFKEVGLSVCQKTTS